MCCNIRSMATTIDYYRCCWCEGVEYTCVLFVFFFCFFPSVVRFCPVVWGEKIAERVFIGLPVTGSMRGR